MKRKIIDNIDIIPVVEIIFDCGGILRIKEEQSIEDKKIYLMMYTSDSEFYFTSKQEVTAFCEELNELSSKIFIT
jgi:hypothetical protein